MPALQLLHITDTHLFSDSSRQLKGICTHDSFHAVIQHAHNKHPCPDAIILGGDMAQDECAASYNKLAEMLSRWSAAWMISPGNHANIEALEHTLIPALDKISSYSRCLQLEEWQVITLNSHEDGSIGGLLAEGELQRLEELLSAEPHKHTLIALHHHPIPIYSRWLDRIGLKNSPALWQIIGRHSNVRSLLCGHIHQAFDCIHNGVRVLGTPSTCIQFKPLQQSFAMDNKSPGYRSLSLMPDGRIQTIVKRIDDFIPADLNNDNPY